MKAEPPPLSSPKAAARNGLRYVIDTAVTERVLRRVIADCVFANVINAPRAPSLVRVMTWQDLYMMGAMVLMKYDEYLEDSLCLWRYMSLDQFAHILASESLWLAPLSSMEDKREGKWIEVEVLPPNAQVQEAYDYAAAQTYISSWIAAPRESLPLWNSHAPADTGIAIATDVHGLIHALAGRSIRDDFFHLMQVEYTDHPKPVTIHLPSSYTPAICAKYKSGEFAYENEVRIVYSRSAMSAVCTTGVPVPAEPGAGTHVPIEFITRIPNSMHELWFLKPAESGEGTHTCIPILPPGAAGVVDYSIVAPASGTRIRIMSIPAILRRGVFVSPRAKPWVVESVASMMCAYGHDASLVKKSALTHLFESQNLPPFKHNIAYD